MTGIRLVRGGLYEVGTPGSPKGSCVRVRERERERERDNYMLYIYIYILIYRYINVYRRNREKA